MTAVRQCRIVKGVIAEVVSLSAYEPQVSALLNEEERMTMEFFLASAPEGHPVIPGAGGFSQGSLGSSRQGKERRPSRDLFFPAEPGRIYMSAIYAKSRQENLSAADQKVLAKLAAQIKKGAKGGR